MKLRQRIDTNFGTSSSVLSKKKLKYYNNLNNIIRISLPNSRIL